MERKYHVAVSRAAFPRPDRVIEAWKSRIECVRTLSRPSSVIWMLCLKIVVSLTLQSADLSSSGRKITERSDLTEIVRGRNGPVNSTVSSPPNPPCVQVRWTKTAGSASDKFQETSIYNETLRIEGIQRVQGGRYYCKADNGVGVAAIKSIRVDVQCKWAGRGSTSRPQPTVTAAIPTVRDGGRDGEIGVGGGWQER